MAAGGEEIYFRSNELGMTMEKIADFRINDFPYVLSVRTDGDETMKTLYHEGEETKRWRVIRHRAGKREYVYQKEFLESVTEYRQDGTVDAIEYYEKGEMSQRHEYRYDDGEIKRILVFDGEGSELYRNIYTRSPSGRLIKVVREYPEKPRFISDYVFTGSGVAQEWHGTEDSGTMFRFSGGEKTLSKESWDGMNLSEREEFVYDGEALETSVYKNYKTGVVERTWYESNGKKARILSTKDSFFFEELVFEYDDSGELAVQYKRSPGTRERWEYFYHENGDRSSELYFKQDRLISKTEFISNDEWLQYLYRDGVPFIKIHFKNEQKVGEEFLLGTRYSDTLY